MFAAAAALRVAAAVAYWPALFAPDSRAYLGLAFFGSPVSFQPDRPSGYPLLIRALMVPGHQLATVTLAQHLAGLLAGTLVYLTLLALGARRWLATVAAALVLLDGYAIALEQYVMSDVLFGAVLVASAWALLRDSGTMSELIVSGALLGVAATLRSAGLFAIPAWLAYLVWAKRGARSLAVWSIALLAPLVGYAALQSSTARGESVLDTSSGWFLYGRVAGFANCRDRDVPIASRFLCPRGRERRKSVAFYLWGPSPAARAFPGGPDQLDGQANNLLRDFALGVIRDQPLEYARAVGSDLLSLAENERGVGQSPDPLLFPKRIRFGANDRSLSTLHRRDFPDSPWPRAGFPASLLRSYQAVFRTQGWLLALLGLASLAAFVMPARHLERRRAELLLLTGGGGLIVLGSVATTGGLLRYAMPTIPLLAAGGALAIDALLSLWRRPGARHRPRGRFPRDCRIRTATWCRS